MDSELLNRFAAERDRYSLFTSSVENLIRRLCSDAGISVEIEARTKSVESLTEKVRRKNYGTLSDIPDLSGVRVIVQYTDDVERVCDILTTSLVIRDDDQHVFDAPDAFGYASRHLVVQLDDDRASLPEWGSVKDLQCEIQVRTILQHAWASISHSLDYKNETDVPRAIRRKLFQVAALIEVGDQLFEDFRTDLAEVRAEYSDQTGGGQWQQLPVDVESLRATWPMWDPAPVGHALAERGVHIADSDRAGAFAETDPEPQILSEIADMAASLRLRTIGALADFVNDADTLDGFLDRFGAGTSSAYSTDYLALLRLFDAIRERELDMPATVEASRHARSLVTDL
ncbi:MAG TPA: hypothetical protein VK906_02825 [Egicoccus sp.]|nr:hypothetical protein [Egicoccus sp.]HSK22077.1 hypothetical protein [Egicoccus sp.]